MTQEQSAEVKRLAERAIRDLTSVGRAWARYGLTASRIALETSATTLQKTASLLGDLSTTLRDRAAEAQAGGQAEVQAEAPAAQSADKPS